MDSVLHHERLDGRAKRLHQRPLNDLPDGVMIAEADGGWAVRGGRLLNWTPAGYGEQMPRPRGGMADVLTPPAVVAVLSAGFRPHWHPSAGP
jgi:hypothetical protein